MEEGEEGSTRHIHTCTRTSSTYTHAYTQVLPGLKTAPEGLKLPMLREVLTVMTRTALK